MDANKTISLAQPPRASELPPKILVVDDQRDSLQLVQTILRLAGMECLTCSNGPSALELLSRQAADVIILDVMMPQMDGYEVCRRLKTSHLTRDTPVLFLTAKLETEDKVRGFEVGGHDYLSKPINREELLARTRAALRVKQLQDQLKEQIELQHRINQLHQGMLGQHWQKTLGQLAASLAHEINNPLTVALGNVQLLAMRNDLADQTKERLRAVDESLQRAGRKLRSLLLIAQTPGQRQIITLAQMIEDLLALVNFQIVLHHVIVKTDLDPHCKWEGLPDELARAVLYVLNNAIEAVAGRTDPTICITVGRDSRQPWIRIRDNGAGISSEARSRIFEPFFSTKGSQHNGLGLYLANEIIRSVGGTIQAPKATEGETTEFIIYLSTNSVT